jgi:flavin reductase (DIM6/NTAB) family NADH-FMN oxidoreductase RutF
MFKEVKVESLELNPFSKIGKEWMLISAGDRKKFNTMTASWGALGHIWQKNTVTVYIRPQRYTKEFVDASGFFSVAFFEQKYKKALALCGEKSGRDTDKIAASGLTPYFTDESVSFAEASLIFVCRKMFHTLLPEAGFDLKEPVKEFYPEMDFHTMYIGEIVKALVKTSGE